MALQLPDAEATSSAQSRLTDKFPSSTTLWLVLRKFEAGVAGASSKKNFTARGVPSSDSGAGRLFYEHPVLTIMGRELSTFPELQKSLAQLGYNNGGVLIKLSFKVTDQPLEEAMTQVQSYFDLVDPDAKAVQTLQPVQEESQEAEKVRPEWLEDQEMVESSSKSAMIPETEDSIQEPQPTIVVSNRPVSVFRPPSSAGPPPVAHIEADYVPTVEHAHAHQRLLQQESRNKRLPTDAEILAKEQEQKEELAKVTNVEIKIRFPDQSSVSSSFSQGDTTSTLYTFVRQCLAPSLMAEPFLLRNPGVRDKTSGAVIENQKRLIVDLQFKGRILMVFSWDVNASSTARGTKSVLKSELASQAREYVAPQIGTDTTDETDKGVTVNVGPSKPTEEGSSKGKVPKWLQGLGKKK